MLPIYLFCLASSLIDSEFVGFSKYLNTPSTAWAGYSNWFFYEKEAWGVR